MMCFVTLIIIGAFAWLYKIYKEQKKAKEIYEYLKEKVMAENKVNVTLLGDEIKSNFGALDEKIWIRIDGERKKDTKIGYYED